MTICLTNCKYDSGAYNFKIFPLKCSNNSCHLKVTKPLTVFQAAMKFGFKEVPEHEDWNLFWSDSCIPLSKMMEMDKYQVFFQNNDTMKICNMATNVILFLESKPLPRDVGNLSKRPPGKKFEPNSKAFSKRLQFFS